jgi:NAD+ diphosphatase
MDRPNFYAGLALDRVSERRGDAEWLAQLIRKPDSRLIPVWRSRNLVAEGATPEAVFLTTTSLTTTGGVAPESRVIFLGLMEETAYFAADLSYLEEDALPTIAGGRGRFIDLRAVGAIMDRQHGGLLAYARGLAHWHSRHLHCGVCGAPTESAEGGHLRRCTNAACATEHFPRTDPAVIMLVTRGDKCLLARNRRFPLPMYSTLAGFVEPGESLEEAVAREVYEESHIRVTDVRYQSSQPWPFPSSIMLGFRATAVTTDIQIDGTELMDAGWFDRAHLRATHDPEKFRIPRGDSIARRLIDDWLAEAP